MVKNGPGSHNSISFFSSIDIAMSLLMESNQRHYLSTILSCHKTLCQDHTTGKWRSFSSGLWKRLAMGCGQQWAVDPVSHVNTKDG